jgi:1-acyl-sn-glycerol-3-phosphate acyltransferase
MSGAETKPAAPEPSDRRHQRPSQLERTRSGARALGMGALTLSMLAGVNLHELLVEASARPGVFERWMQNWAQVLLRLFGVRALVRGSLQPAAAGRARLIVSNHRSPIDILLLLRHCGGVVLSRADLAAWPVLGPAARKAGTIFVDRDDTVSGVLAIRALRDRLLKERTVIVFPEGTTLAGDEVRAFQEGAFVAARGLPVDIVPVGIAYEPGSEFLDESFMEHVTRVSRRRVTRVALAFGPSRAAPTQRKGLADALRGEVQVLVQQAREALDAGS